MRDVIRVRGPLLTTAVLLGALLLLAACEDNGDAGEGLEAGERELFVQATEQDSTRDAGEPDFPEHTIEQWSEYDWDGDDGYFLVDDGDTWDIGSYLFHPASATLVEGDQVRMEVFNVRGSEHDLLLDHPDGAEEYRTERGDLIEIEFEATEPGHFQLICETHPPTMNFDFVVLPAGG